MINELILGGPTDTLRGILRSLNKAESRTPLYDCDKALKLKIERYVSNLS